MKTVFLASLLLSQIALSSIARAESASVSGCILILGINDSVNGRPSSERHRLVVMAPFQSSQLETHRGQARFSEGGKDWHVDAEYSFRKLEDGKFEGSLSLSVNGLSGSSAAILHPNARSYSEKYFIRTVGGLDVLDVGDEAFRRAEKSQFWVFSFCTPRFEESDRSDTIYL